MITIAKVHELADHLIREGFVDNEPDAQLFAIRILVGAEHLAEADEWDDDIR